METNMKGIKSANCRNVFRLIYRENAISKQEIARELNMSLPTVSGHLATLKADNLITDDEMFESVMGRRARAIRVNKDRFMALGLEITPAGVNLSALNLKNEIIDCKQTRITYERSQAYCETVQKLARQYVCQRELSDRHLTGVGISVPAIVDGRDNRIVSSYVLGLENYLFENAQWEMDCPIKLFNSPKAAAITELTGKSQDGASSFVYLWIGANIGSSIIYENRRLVGNHFREGEISHLPIVPDGKPHYCGKNGCFGAYCELNELAKLSNHDIAAFFSGLKEHKKDFEKAWDEYLRYLAMGINSLRTLFDLDIVLGGDLALYIEGYMDALQEKIREISRFSESGDYIHLAGVKQYAASIGAAQQMNLEFLKGCGVLD